MPISTLATKLYIPPPRAKIVPRPHLIERLNEGLSSGRAPGVTLISASAGFGKTTLVSEWVASCGRPVAWLSLDHGDSNLSRFLTCIIAALQTIQPALGENLLAALQAPQPPPVETLLTSLLNEISALPNDLTLVLDDYHLPRSIRALFGPQHGIRGEKQDNMIESSDFIHPRFNIPAFSLYGASRSPTADMLDLIDILIIDLQDVGTRVYTFISTMAYCLQAAGGRGKKVVVLDRPNPIWGEQVEGNLLRDDCRSFVGVYPLPMRHGLTIGELALLFNDLYGIHCELEVISLEGWRRNMLFRETGLTWVPPSPNMASPETALVYPGQVLLEGTNLSEGRGTTRPFEIAGAPFIEPVLIKGNMEGRRLPGIILRETYFQPTT